MHLLKANTSQNIDKLLEQFVADNPFKPKESKNSLVTIEEIPSTNKPRKRNSGGFNLIIKKVEKQPEK